MYNMLPPAYMPCRPKICIWILKAGQAPVAVSYAYAAAMPTGLMVVNSEVKHFLKVNILFMHPCIFTRILEEVLAPVQLVNIQHKPAYNSFTSYI